MMRSDVIKMQCQILIEILLSLFFTKWQLKSRGIYRRRNQQRQQPCLHTMAGTGIPRKNGGCPMLHQFRLDRSQRELQVKRNVQTASADRAYWTKLISSYGGLISTMHRPEKITRTGKSYIENFGPCLVIAGCGMTLSIQQENRTQSAGILEEKCTSGSRMASRETLCLIVSYVKSGHGTQTWKTSPIWGICGSKEPDSILT